MSIVLSQDLLNAVACPECQSKLVLTREAVLVCASCLIGFRVRDGIPDLRSDKAIILSRRSSVARASPQASITVEKATGNDIGRVITLKNDCCLVLGRADDDPLDDTTFIGKPEWRIPLDRSLWPYIQKYLTKKNRFESTMAPPLLSGAHTLGDFRREPDELFDDAKLSRCHALLYRSEGTLYIMDLVSRSGTFVNDREIEQSPLHGNDLIRIGQIQLKVHNL